MTCWPCLVLGDPRDHWVATPCASRESLEAHLVTKLELLESLVWIPAPSHGEIDLRYKLEAEMTGLLMGCEGTGVG